MSDMVRLCGNSGFILYTDMISIIVDSATAAMQSCTREQGLRQAIAGHACGFEKQTRGIRDLAPPNPAPHRQIHSMTHRRIAATFSLLPSSHCGRGPRSWRSAGDQYLDVARRLGETPVA